jgi:hypothetical protein
MAVIASRADVTFFTQNKPMANGLKLVSLYDIVRALYTRGTESAVMRAKRVGHFARIQSSHILYSMNINTKETKAWNLHGCDTEARPTCVYLMF